MGKRIVLTLSLLSFSGHSEEGLFKVKDTRVPGSIEVASESVLQIVLVGGDAHKIPQNQYDAYIASNPGENFVLSLTIQKVRICKHRELPTCDVNYKSYGSGFLTDDGKSLWTARHVIAPQLGQKFLFEIYNAEGEKVFDTTDSKDQATLELVGSERAIQMRHPQVQFDQGTMSLFADYAKFRLNRNLSIRALRMSAKRPIKNQRVFTAGYANVAGLRAFASSGGVKTRARVAIGIVSQLYETPASENEAQKKNRLLTEEFSSQHLISMDLDGLPGQSGSPVLNESGEVIGVFVAGNATISGRGALKGLAPHFEGILQNPK